MLQERLWCSVVRLGKGGDQKINKMGNTNTRGITAALIKPVNMQGGQYVIEKTDVVAFSGVCDIRIGWMRSSDENHPAPSLGA